ncbi:ATP-binding protein [Larkinella sp. VNQ87]|uniref:PAS domain-containing sensor histidine kinase n=1 Tax=Larkinella sp. VNQ87 TaxID=3400921 RepID=UPI003BFBB98B
MPPTFTDYAEHFPLFYQIVSDSQTGVVVFEAIQNEAEELVDFRFAYINPAGAAYLGKKPEQLLGQRYLAFFSEAHSSGLFDAYCQVLKTGEPLRLPEVYYNADGINGWFDLRISKFDHAVVVSYSNITAQKQTQLALEAQALQLRTTLDASISSIFYMTAIRNEQGRIIDFLMVMSNKAVLRSNNMTPEQVEGRQLLKVFPGNVDNGFFDLYVRVTETGQPESNISYYRDDLGLEGWFEVSAVKQDDGVVVTFMNITDQKRTENELQQKNAELQRSNQSLQTFAYIASHDLQAPLRKLQAFNSVLTHQFGADLKPEAKDILDRMNVATARMSSLIHDLLLYSRVTTQPHSLTRISLIEVVADVVSDLDPIILETGTSMQIDPLPEVTGNAVELGQLFQNLLGNALKFRRPGVPPVVSVTHSLVVGPELPEVLKPKQTPARFHRIRVADNGIGFQAKDRDRIFQMFQRLHHKNEFEGTGIGLAICQRVAENHGGTIIAEGRPNEGAVFDVYLPV